MPNWKKCPENPGFNCPEKVQKSGSKKGPVHSGIFGGGMRK